VAGIGGVRDEQVARVGGRERHADGVHELAQVQVGRRAEGDEQQPSGRQRAVQGAQAALVRRLRQVREDRERERELERALERQPLRHELAARELRRHAVRAADLEDRLRRVAAEQPLGRHLAREHTREPAPAAAEVEHRGVLQRTRAVARELLAHTPVEGGPLSGQPRAARTVPALLQRRVRGLREHRADAGEGLVLLRQQQRPQIRVEGAEVREALRPAAGAARFEARELGAVEVRQPGVVALAGRGGRRPVRSEQTARPAAERAQRPGGGGTGAPAASVRHRAAGYPHARLGRRPQRPARRAASRRARGRPRHRAVRGRHLLRAGRADR